LNPQLNRTTIHLFTLRGADFIRFLPPAVGRLPFDFIASVGPLWFYGFPDVLALIALGYDTWHNEKLNKAFALGLGLIIASQPLRLWFGGTETWLQFAAWLTR